MLVDLLAVLAIFAAVAVMVLVLEGPVPPVRVAQFAKRYGLGLSPESADVVKGYLGTTRRWRVVGLTGILVYIGSAGVARHLININGVAIFLGWFGGAIVAEWRVNVTSSGTRRGAMLTPRRAADYLGRPVIAAPMVAAAAVVALGAVDLAWQPSGSRRLPAAVLLGSCAVVALVGEATRRRVLTRPQSAALEPSVIAADDAIRGRSLHVVIGSVTCFLLTIAGGLVQISPLGRPTGTVVDAALLLLGAAGGGLIAGWAPAPRARQSSAGPVQAEALAS